MEIERCLIPRSGCYRLPLGLSDQSDPPPLQSDLWAQSRRRQVQWVQWAQWVLCRWDRLDLSAQTIREGLWRRLLGRLGQEGRLGHLLDLLGLQCLLVQSRQRLGLLDHRNQLDR